MKKKTILISAVVAVVLSLVGVYYYRLQNKAKVYYWRSISVERGDVNIFVTATGTLAADTSVDVGVQVSGTIAKITADFYVGCVPQRCFCRYRHSNQASAGGGFERGELRRDYRSAQPGIEADTGLDGQLQ